MSVCLTILTLNHQSLCSLTEQWRCPFIYERNVFSVHAMKARRGSRRPAELNTGTQLCYSQHKVSGLPNRLSVVTLCTSSTPFTPCNTPTSAINLTLWLVAKQQQFLKILPTWRAAEHNRTEQSRSPHKYTLASGIKNRLTKNWTGQQRRRTQYISLWSEKRLNRKTKKRR
jgi:hypothetical protein